MTTISLQRFAYISADPGIPVPGGKGASIHVASVCAAFRRCGLEGEVHSARPDGGSVAGTPLKRLPKSPVAKDAVESREVRRFLGALATVRLEERPDFIYERYSLWYCGGLACARALGVPYILEVNSPLPREAARYRELEHPDLANGIAALLLRNADGVVCVSEEVARWVEELRGDTDGVWTIPNGVDEELFRPASGDRTENLRPDVLPAPPAPLIAFSGSFKPWHGLESLLDAVALVRQRFPDVAVVCVGDGPERERIEARAVELGLAESVHFTGQVPHPEVALWLRGADVAVAPYPQLDDFYFSPLKIFEFLALELPVVSTAIGQVRDLLPDGQRGFLCEPGSPQSLADTLVRVLENRDDARRVARRGHEWVLEHATWGARVAEILQRVKGVRERMAQRVADRGGAR